MPPEASADLATLCSYESLAASDDGASLATPKTTSGVASAIIVEKGGKIMADGSATHPITMTALNPHTTSSSTVTTATAATTDAVLETRGKWGGLIILGKAPTSAATASASLPSGVVAGAMASA